jgi:hypothetical protein
MATELSYYPPSPTDVPPRLSSPSLRYRIQVVLVLGGLFLFLLLYIGTSAWSFCPLSWFTWR